MITWWMLWIITLAVSLALATGVPLLIQTAMAVNVDAMGDIGCKSDSIKNLKVLGAGNEPFIGVGDYMYGCSPSKEYGGQKLQTYYNAIEAKVGSPGNHEKVNHQQESWAQNTFKYGDRGYGSWKLGNIGIIILDPYQSYKQGSNQYNYVVGKMNQFANRTDIVRTVVVVHEPMWSPVIIGAHADNTGLRNTYGPLLKEHDAFLIEAHNHATAFGTREGVEIALCGGGGYGGDSFSGKESDAKGFNYVSMKFGHCDFDFQRDKSIVRHVGTDGNTLKEFTYNHGN
jgi:hypothetical protein